MEYLDYLRRFWQTDSIYQAMFEKIHVDPEIEKLATLAEKKEKWDLIAKRDIKRLTKEIPVKREWRVLEIGCGIGRLIRPLSEFFSRVEGVDISESMVNFAGQYLANLKNVNVRLNNGMDLSGFADNSFDFIFSMIVFQHIRSAKVVRTYLEESFRTLKPEGYFRFQVYRQTAGQPFGEHDTEAENIEAGFYGNAYNPEQLRELMQAAGFSRLHLLEEQEWIWVTARKIVKDY
jgi:cyclopropane fatty-acyl-phospholipid synthase-like methyltransferase